MGPRVATLPTAKGIAVASVGSGSTPFGMPLSPAGGPLHRIGQNQKVLPMCLGDSVTYVLERTPQSGTG